ncbi:alpha/beta hydrolase [Burkholderia stagnalis]|uniref:alpha/beta hydrolase n=1 Tax=Burkholderia stagnalis TaxID=1503054 RepID=UPI0039BF572E
MDETSRTAYRKSLERMTNTPMTDRSTAVAIMLRVAIACLVAFTGVAVVQDRLIYFPEKAAIDDIVSSELRVWPSPEDFRGLLAEPPESARGTVIVFHGNAGHAGHRAYYATALARIGLRVILAEYPGYGPRDGTPSEASLVADAQRTTATAYRQYGAPLLLIGESLAAAAGAHERDKITGLLLITPWDSPRARRQPPLPVAAGEMAAARPLRQRRASRVVRPPCRGGSRRARQHRSCTLW